VLFFVSFVTFVVEIVFVCLVVYNAKRESETIGAGSAAGGISATSPGRPKSG